MTILLPAKYYNAPNRPGDVTDIEIDLYNVVTQINNGASGKVTITQPANSATITILDGKTFTVDNTLELIGTDGTAMTFPTTNATIARTDAGQTFTGAQVMTVSSASAALTVTQTGAGNSMVVEDSTSPDSSPWLIDASGNMVQGYTAAVGTGGVAGIPAYQIHGLTNSISSIGLTNWSSVASRNSVVQFSRSTSNTIGTRGLIADGTTLGSVAWTGDDGTNYVAAATISAATDGTTGTNDMPGRLVFSTTADGASSPTEAMRINSRQEVGVGSTLGTAGRSFTVAKNITGATTSIGMRSSGIVQSDVTVEAIGYQTSLGTATGFTLTDLEHYVAGQGTFSGTVTNQYGFFVASTLTGATNNYGIYGNIAAAANRYNLYMAGTADNFMSGSLGLGSTPNADTKLNLLGTYPTSGNITYVSKANGTIPSGTTTGAVIYQSAPSTQAAAFTVGSLWHFQAVQGTIGAASAVTNQYGFQVDSSLTGATTNYGFHANIAAGSGRWNFYGNGTARSLLNGDLTVFGGTAIPAGGTAGTGIMVSSTANFGVFFGSGAPSLSAAKGSLYMRSDGTGITDRMYVNTNGTTGWTNVVTAA